MMCRVLGVSTSGYYDWRRRPLSDQAKRKLELMSHVEMIHLNSRKLYGAPRITAALNALGYSVSRSTISTWMKEAKLFSKTKKRFRVMTTDSKHKLPVAANVLNREFTVEKPGMALASDITYIPTYEGWLYLAVTIDLYSRKVAGWSMDLTMTEKLVSDALLMAIGRIDLATKVIHHSDRGSQYASQGFRENLKLYEITQSMSRKGNCWDNAPVESFFHTLKTELVYFENYSTREEARKSIFEYIEIFYNRIRLHSSLNYKSPVDFEQTFANCA